MTHRTGRVRTVQPLLALLLGAAATAGLLLATRPAPAAALAWSGDDLAVALLWWGAVIASVWFAITTLACVAALARGRTRSAHRIARFAPPLARRVLVAALISTWALVPTAAYAAPSHTAPSYREASYRGPSHADHTHGDPSDGGESSAPMTVHTDERGRLTIDPAPDRPATVHPAASTPTTTATTAGTTTATTATTATTTPDVSPPATKPPTVAPITHSATSAPRTSPTPRPRTSPAAPVVRVAPTTSSATPVPTTASIAPRVGARTHVVVAGDNLWDIARTEVARVAGTQPVTDDRIAPYWHLLITANRATLRSGDPSVIFPGEVVALP